MPVEGGLLLKYIIIAFYFIWNKGLRGWWADHFLYFSLCSDLYNTDRLRNNCDKFTYRKQFVSSEESHSCSIFNIVKNITINRKYCDIKPSLWLKCFEGCSWAFYCHLWLKKKTVTKKVTGITWQNVKQSSAKQQPGSRMTPSAPNFQIWAVRQKATPELILAALLKH